MLPRLPKISARLLSSVHPPSQRHANLGSTVDYLRQYVPRALHSIPDQSRLSPEITLRVSPTIQNNVPMIKGSMSYVTTIKAIQLIMTSFILSHRTQLHITDLEVDEDGKMNYGMISGSTKVIVKWRTCLPDCIHLKPAQEDNRGLDKVLGVLGNDHHLGSKLIFGMFVFELNHNCDLIEVHNLENVEMLDKEDFIDDLGNLAPSA